MMLVNEEETSSLFHSPRIIVAGDFNCDFTWTSHFPFHITQRLYTWPRTKLCELYPPWNQLTYLSKGRLFIIHYLYAAPSVHPSIIKYSVEVVNSAWTDHALLISFKLKSKPHGKRIWKATPNLAKSTFFIFALYHALYHQLHKLLSEESTKKLLISEQ